MDKIELKCNSCNAPLTLNIKKLSMYCPYCGSKLMFYADDINKILLEREKTRQAEIEMLKEKNRLDYMSKKEQVNLEVAKSPFFYVFLIIMMIATTIIIVKG